MKNLTEELLKAKEMPAAWTSNRLSTVIEAWKKVDHSIKIDWDTGAGENWVSFFAGYEKIGILGVCVPVLFLDSSYSGINDARQIFETVHVVMVDDFDAKEWFIVMKQFDEFVPQLFNTPSIDITNPNSMSINDFWFETITI